MDAPHFVLIHALLVDPLTWAPVAAVLRQKGFAVTLPRLGFAISQKDLDA